MMMCLVNVDIIEKGLYIMFNLFKNIGLRSNDAFVLPDVNEYKNLCN